jgi:flagella basal body P-ring formation protein FlgA
MMKMILLIGLLCLGGVWWLDAESALAAKSQSGHVAQQSIHARDFEKAIYSVLTRQYGRPHHRMKVRILSPKKPLPVSLGKIHLEVEELVGEARTGRRSFRVGLYINGYFTKTINVVGEVKVQANVVTPVRWIKSKEVIVKEDVTIMTVDVPSLTHDFILQPDDVIGKQVLRSLTPRRPIRKIMLDDPPLVHKGDRVMLEVRQGGLLVQAVGLAKAAGKSGDTIPVQNKSSGREVIGTILSAGVVEVGF